MAAQPQDRNIALAIHLYTNDTGSAFKSPVAAVRQLPDRRIVAAAQVSTALIERRYNAKSTFETASR
jgi:hypothetical protein